MAGFGIATLKARASKKSVFGTRKAMALGVAGAALMAGARMVPAAGINYIWVGTNSRTWDTATVNWSGGTGKWVNGSAGNDNSVTFDTTAGGYNAANGKAISTSGNFTYISGIAFAQGDWTLGDAGTTTTLTNADSAGLTITDSGANTINAKIVGLTKLTINGTTPETDVVTMAGVSTGTGAVIINNATVDISANTGLGSATSGAAITLNNGVISATATMSFSNSRGSLMLGSSAANSGGTLDVTGSNTLTYASAIVNNGGVDSLIKTNTGTLALTSNNTYTGTTTIKGGTLSSTVGGISPTPFGRGGTILLGDTGGMANATLLWAPTLGASITNGITVQSGSSLNTLTINSSTSTATIIGTFAVNNAVTIAELTPAKFFNFSGQITGSSPITIGSGNLGVVSLANVSGNATSYSGPITIDAGILSFATASLGSGNLTFGGSSTLQWNGAADDVSAQLQPLTGSIVATLDTNGNAVTFGTANGLAGPSTSGFTKLAGSAGVLTLAASNSFGGTYTPATTGDATLLMNANALQSATVNLLTGNTGGGLMFDASVTANGRMFTLGNLTGAGSLAIQDNASTPDAITLSIGGNGGSSILSGVLSGAGSLVWNGAGTLALTGTANTYAGPTTVMGGGTVAISADRNLGSTPVSATAQMVQFNGGTLEATGSFALSSNRGMSATASTVATINIDVVGGATLTYGGIMADGEGAGATTSFNKLDSGEMDISGVSTFGGSITIGGGTLKLVTDGSSGNNRLPTGAALSNSGTFDLGGWSQQLRSYSGAGTVTNSAGGSVGVLTLTSTSSLASNLVDGAGRVGLTVSGASTVVTLSGANSFSGPTTLTSGMLELQGSGQITASALTLNGGVLQLRSDTNNDLFTDISTAISASVTINADQLTGAGLGNILKMGPITNTAAISNTITVTAGDGYGLSLGAVTSNVVGAGNITFNNTIAQVGASGSLAIASITYGANTSSETVAFTGGGNTSVTGAISQASAGVNVTVNDAGGTVTLAGVNTYTGTTMISGGTLALASASNNIASSSTITVGATAGDGSILDVTGVTGGFTLGASQTLAGHGTVNGAVASVSTNHISPGNGAGVIGTLSFSTGLTLAAGTNLDYDVGPALANHTFVAGSSDSIAVTGGAGSLNFSGQVTLNLLTGAGNLTGSGSYELFSYTTAGAVGTFTSGDGTTGSILLGTGWGSLAGDTVLIANDTTAQGIFLDFTAPVSGVPAGSGTWHNGSNDGKWTTNTAAGSNWNTGIPNGADQSALFDDSAVGGAGTVLLDGDKTVGELDLHTTSAGYTIGADSTYTLNFQASGHAVISVTGTGSHTINANSNLVSTTDVSVATGGSLNMVGAVSGGALTLAGGGTLTLSSPTGNTYGGPTTVSGGTLIVSNATGSATGAGDVTLNGGTLGGAGKISGNVLASSNDHTIYPSAGLVSPTSATNLTLGSLTTSSHTTLEFNLDGGITNHGVGVGLDLGTSDTITTGTLTLNGGTIAIANTQTGMNSLGYYKLIAYSSIAGAGLSSLTLPTAPAGTAVVYTLDTSHDTGFIDLHRGFTGDANDDGVVNFTDFISLASDFGQPGDWAQGDFNGDGIVNFTDFIALAANFGQTIGGASETVSASEVAEFNAAASSFFGSPSSVPEPTSLALMGLGAVALLKRRRKV